MLAGKGQEPDALYRLGGIQCCVDVDIVSGECRPACKRHAWRGVDVRAFMQKQNRLERERCMGLRVGGS